MGVSLFTQREHPHVRNGIPGQVHNCGHRYFAERGVSSLPPPPSAPLESTAAAPSRYYVATVAQQSSQSSQFVTVLPLVCRLNQKSSINSSFIILHYIIFYSE